MSVRNRLAVILAAALLPLLIGAGIVVGLIVPTHVHQETHARLRLAAGSVAALQVRACASTGDAARLMALAAAKGEPAVLALQDGLDAQGYGAILLAGTVLARSSPLPAGLVVDRQPAVPCSAPVAGAQTPPRPTASISSGATSAPAAVSDSVSVGGAHGEVVAVAATLLDRTRLLQWRQDVGAGAHVELALACPGGSAADTSGGSRGRVLQQAALDALTGRPADVGDSEVEQAAPGAGHPCAVIASTRISDVLSNRWLTGGVLTAALLIGAALVWWLARQLTMPILAVTDAAEAAAAGDLTRRLPETRDDELGRLAASFNHMTGQLDLRLTEVQHSRDLLAENIRRLGDALQRTHDLDGLLAAVCAIAAATTRSTRATVWLLEGNSLLARVAWPADAIRGQPRRVPKGATLPGLVVADGRARHVGAGDQTNALGGPALATPLQRGETMLGAVVVERAVGAEPYDDDDVATLASITGPAGIAMDNALLHRQAQRLSVIDPLTGVGNLRMLTTTLGREVDRARHFGRSAALLVIDIDHFREINDVHGHAVGDAILAAVAARVTASVRTVDRVARYGGEEFAVVCPELDAQQALTHAEHVWAAVRDRPFEVDGATVAVRVSVGVASWPQQAATSAELLRAADAAMSQAKDRGRDQVARVTLPSG